MAKWEKKISQRKIKVNLYTETNKISKNSSPFFLQPSKSKDIFHLLLVLTPINYCTSVKKA